MLQQNTYTKNNLSEIILMQKGELSMKKYVALGSVVNTTPDGLGVDARGKVYDFSVTEIVRDGKTLTVCFPDEGKPLDLES